MGEKSDGWGGGRFAREKEACWEELQRKVGGWLEEISERRARESAREAGSHQQLGGMREREISASLAGWGAWRSRVIVRNQ